MAIKKRNEFKRRPSGGLAGKESQNRLMICLVYINMHPYTVIRSQGTSNSSDPPQTH